MNRLGTHSVIEYTKKSATQSSLETYIQAKMEIAENTGLKYTPLKQGLTYSIATHSNDKTPKNNFSKTFGLIKSLGTHSIISDEKTNKGITPSHPALQISKKTLEFKTQSYSDTNGLFLENGKIQYNNPRLIKGTQSDVKWASKLKNSDKPLGKNAILLKENIGLTNSNISKMNQKFSKNLNKFSENTNTEKKFYIKPNLNTKVLDIEPFLDFVSKITENAEKMIKLQEVTVNGEVVTDINFILKSGDVVRVGMGHYINNSNQIVKVK